MKKKYLIIILAVIVVIAVIVLLTRDSTDYAKDFRNGAFVAQESTSRLSEENRASAMRRLEDARARRIDYGALSAYLREADALVELGANGEALAVLKEAEMRYGDEGEFYEAKGDLLVQMRQYKDAARDYEKAIDLAPSFSSPYLSLVELYQDYSNVPEKAERVFEQALENGADDRAILVNYASFLEVQKKDLEEALEVWIRAGEKAGSEGELRAVVNKIKEIREKLGLPPEPEGQG